MCVRACVRACVHAYVRACVNSGTRKNNCADYCEIKSINLLIKITSFGGVTGKKLIW